MKPLSPALASSPNDVGERRPIAFSIREPSMRTLRLVLVARHDRLVGQLTLFPDVDLHFMGVIGRGELPPEADAIGASRNSAFTFN